MHHATPTNIMGITTGSPYNYLIFNINVIVIWTSTVVDIQINNNN